MNKAILSVLGHDRPGIVAAVTDILFDLNCNIENVSQTILQTEFSGSFIVSLPQDLSLDDLQERFIENLTPMELHVHIEPLLKKKRRLLPGSPNPLSLPPKVRIARGSWPVSVKSLPAMV